MALKPGKVKTPSTGSVKFDTRTFSTGAQSGQVLHYRLGTASLKGAGGSNPAPSACTIVDEFNANYDLREHVNIDDVKKALSKPATLKAIQKAKKPGDVLNVLGLQALLLLADYNSFNASRFVKGHLLPQKLGGPGVEWNLTPMDRSANALWESSFEKPVRKGLEQALKLEKVHACSVIVDYKVTLSGSMKPWFPNATSQTRTLLAKLPSKVVGKADVADVIPKSGAGKVNAPVVKQFEKIFGMSLALSL